MITKIIIRFIRMLLIKSGAVETKFQVLRTTKNSYIFIDNILELFSYM